MENKNNYIRWFEGLSIEDVPIAGGKNASLGEMVRAFKNQGIRVPDGFVTTANAYWDFLEANHLKEPIKRLLGELKDKNQSLKYVGRSIRQLFLKAEFPADMAAQIKTAYHDLSRRYQMKQADVAVRSSATAEDLPDASFAGQQETFLNVLGEDQVIDACRRCFASLFTDRAIVYRREKGFDDMKVALSIGIQKMVRSDLAGSGVMFSIDTETGFPHVVVINAAWGLGETVVQGTVDPDEFEVFKPFLLEKKGMPIIEKNLGGKTRKMIYGLGKKASTKTILTSQKERSHFVLTDDEILTLARWATLIEKHYGKPMDMEWAKDGKTKQLFIVQARPDALTNLHNARYLHEQLSIETESAKRYNTPLTCLMLDIDNFKTINDKYGHPSGDIILTTLAKILRQCVRRVDIVGRLGGEEFLVVMPHTSCDIALPVAERIRQAVQRWPFKMGGQEISVTVSIGVACYPSSGINDKSDLLNAADDALYEAKRTGKNRTVLAPSNTVSSLEVK